MTFSLSGGAYPGVAALYLSIVPAAPLQLSPGCLVQVDLSLLVNLGTQPLSAAGAATWSLALPDQPTFAGVSLMTQAAVVSSNTLRLSNGRRLVFGY